MFSYEDRLRAVQLYIKLGKRVGLTIQQLGFPTKNTLKHWYQEYEQGLGLATRSTRAPTYSQAQKEFAVAHYLENGRCFATTIKVLGYPPRTLLPFCAQKLGVSRPSLYTWKNQLLGHDAPASMKRKQDIPHDAGRSHRDRHSQ
ncbi:hypothetical protein [Xanthomonas albilineans]|uniref:hypothetical protein n=1 Tax=Xanthomonas albilineans TaxID=29447 RepID=UPI000A42A728